RPARGRRDSARSVPRLREQRGPLSEISRVLRQTSAAAPGCLGEERPFLPPRRRRGLSSRQPACRSPSPRHGPFRPRNPRPRNRGIHRKIPPPLPPYSHPLARGGQGGVGWNGNGDRENKKAKSECLRKFKNRKANHHEPGTKSSYRDGSL